MRILAALLLAVTATVFAEDIPRPEYPQPQFQRDDWMNLNGTWQFGFDEKLLNRTITVPFAFAFESPKSGIGDTSFHPVVWYRRTFYLSEFGGIAFIPDKSKVPETAWGYSGVEKTADDALTRLRGVYEAIAGIHAITGICYTQLTDVEQEVNGLLTYDRHPKFDAARIRALNDLLK